MEKDRPFFVRAFWSGGKRGVVIGIINPQYTCIGLFDSKRSTPGSHKWLLRQIPTTIVVTRTTIPRAIIKAVWLRYQVLVDYQAANKAKHTIQGRTMAQQAQNYQLFELTSGNWRSRALGLDRREWTLFYNVKSQSAAHSAPWRATDLICCNCPTEGRQWALLLLFSRCFATYPLGMTAWSTAWLK